MSRLKRQIIMLTLTLGAVLAAKVYLNRILATEAAPGEAPVAAGSTDTGVAVEAPVAAADATQAAERGAAPKAR